MDDLMRIDLYELLNISGTADEKEVKKAYRKRALSCHPDKNPDNPKAVELFQQLSKALEVLSDPAARAAYDEVLSARKAAQIRHRELDSKRKKFKEDLEAREKYVPEELEKKEIERLRKEGLQQLEAQRLLLEELEKEKLVLNKRCDPQICASRLKVKWKSHKKDENNGGYNQEMLESIFRNYGHATCLVSSKKKGSAIVEFSSSEAAQQAFENEKGIKDNPLTMSWISGQPETSNSLNNGKTSQAAPDLAGNSVLTSRDYESLVLMRLRQTEERKKLIQKMQDDDD